MFTPYKHHLDDIISASDSYQGMKSVKGSKLISLPISELISDYHGLYYRLNPLQDVAYGTLFHPPNRGLEFWKGSQHTSISMLQDSTIDQIPIFRFDQIKSPAITSCPLERHGLPFKIGGTHDLTETLRRIILPRAITFLWGVPLNWTLQTPLYGMAV